MEFAVGGIILAILWGMLVFIDDGDETGANLFMWFVIIAAVYGVGSFVLN